MLLFAIHRAEGPDILYTHFVPSGLVPNQLPPGYWIPYQCI